jgi:hypothetical protein
MQIKMLGPHWSKKMDQDLHCSKCVSEHCIIYSTLNMSFLVPNLSSFCVFEFI